MFESFVAFIIPVVKEIVWAAAIMLLTYALNKLQGQTA
jgi:hypothetical protein